MATDAVVDTSALVEVVVHSSRAIRVDEALADLGATTWHVPTHARLECLQAIRSLLHGGVIRPERAALAVEHLRTLPLQSWPIEPFETRVWQLRDNFTAYDAAFVALAEGLDLPLVTFDARLARGLEVVHSMVRVRALRPSQSD